MRQVGHAMTGQLSSVDGQDVKCLFKREVQLAALDLGGLEVKWLESC